jgi:hypothetical protein
MTTWNDVLAALTRNPMIQTLTPVAGATRAVRATVATQNHGELTMTVDNETNEQWLQLAVAISPNTTDARIWQTASTCLENAPAVGLARADNSIVIRHGIHLPQASNEAINGGIATITTAAATLYDAATHQAR